jgi:diaminopimelate epimerase
MIQFTKMHGLGNDFMVINALETPLCLSPEKIRALSQRDTGVGFDQCLIIEPSHLPEVDFFYRIFNADGQEVGQCGNGARCLARFLQHYQLSNKQQITVATRTTRLTLQLNDDKTVTVNMGQPELEPARIPFLAPKQAAVYTLGLKNNTSCTLHALQIGNPHAVLVLPRITSQKVKQWGKAISTHPSFPEQSNVGFMQIKNSDHIQLRVYERGCGETKACGSGAVAAAAIGMLYHQLDEAVRVSLPGGELFVHWPNRRGDIFLTGPASFVYEGRLIVGV